MALSEQMYPDLDGAPHPATTGEAPAIVTREYELSGEAFGDYQIPGKVAVEDALKAFHSDPVEDRHR